ncbi:MAG: hypothetical protein MHM6MM_006548 [Cercozoa sp. M6MM]
MGWPHSSQVDAAAPCAGFRSGVDAIARAAGSVATQEAFAVAALFFQPAAPRVSSALNLNVKAADANTTSSAELRRMMTRDSPASMRDVRLRHVAPMPELSHSLVPPPLRKQKRAQTAPLSKHSFTRVAPIVETGLSVSSSASSSTSSTASKQESQHRPLARLCLDVSDLTLNASDVKPPDDQELDPFATPPLSPVEMPEHLPTEVPSEPGPKLLSIVGDTHPERRRTARSASRTAPQRESAHESNDTNETENSAMHSLVTNLSSSFAEAGSPCPSNEVDQLLSKFRTVLVDFEERARQGGDQRLQEVRWRLQAATDLLAQLT